MAGPVMKRARGAGVELQLAVWKGRGAPVLAVHGLTANCRCWDVVAAGIAPGHEVIAVDLRGRGLSDKPRSGYSVDQHCRDLLALMDDLGTPRATLMGHSLGAIICLALAAKHPGRVDRLVLVDGAGKLGKAQTQRVFAGIKPSLDRLGCVFPSFADYTARMKQAPFLQPWNRALESYFRYEVMEVEGGVMSRVSPSCIRQEVANMMKLAIAPLYARVRCPTLILRAPQGMLADNDVLLPKSAVRKMTGDIASAWLAEIAGTNHYSIMFQPGKTRDRVLKAFLEA